MPVAIPPAELSFDFPAVRELLASRASNPGH